MIKSYNGSIFKGNFNTLTFAETWETAEDFLNDYHGIGIPVTISDENVNTLYYLLYARYADDHKASYNPK